MYITLSPLVLLLLVQVQIHVPFERDRGNHTTGPEESSGAGSEPLGPSLGVSRKSVCVYVFKCFCPSPLKGVHVIITLLLRAFLQQTRQRPPIRLSQKRSFLLFLFSQTLLQHITFLPNTPWRHSIIHFLVLFASLFLPSRTNPFHSFPVSHSRTRTTSVTRCKRNEEEKKKILS